MRFYRQNTCVVLNNDLGNTYVVLQRRFGNNIKIVTVLQNTMQGYLHCRFPRPKDTIVYVSHYLLIYIFSSTMQSSWFSPETLLSETHHDKETPMLDIYLWKEKLRPHRHLNVSKKHNFRCNHHEGSPQRMFVETWFLLCLYKSPSFRRQYPKKQNPKKEKVVLFTICG